MMHRQKLLLAVCGIATAAASHAQSPPTSLKFEVASLKPSQPDPRGFAGIRPAPGGERYVASNVTLKLMITVAYRIQADQAISFQSMSQKLVRDQGTSGLCAAGG